jgi:sulfatase maturation enzyme AslB (radical SAM superfamily)
MGIAVQLVTSAVREIPKEWAGVRGLQLVVSVDGLQPEHDVRRTPATYDRILKSIAGHQIIVHCTITRQMVGRAGYFEEFLSFWSNRDEVAHIWLSLFTPQAGAAEAEVIPLEEREALLSHLAQIRHGFPKLLLPDSVIQGYRRPPASPDQCLFARTTLSLTADLNGRITPCQFGGNPDCTQCGCIASAGLNAVGDHRLLGIVSLRSILNVSAQIGKVNSRILRHPT